MAGKRHTLFRNPGRGDSVTSPPHGWTSLSPWCRDSWRPHPSQRSSPQRIDERLARLGEMTKVNCEVSYFISCIYMYVYVHVQIYICMYVSIYLSISILYLYITIYICMCITCIYVSIVRLDGWTYTNSQLGVPFLSWAMENGNGEPMTQVVEPPFYSPFCPWFRRPASAIWRKCMQRFQDRAPAAEAVRKSQGPIGKELSQKGLETSCSRLSSAQASFTVCAPSSFPTACPYAPCMDCLSIINIYVLQTWPSFVGKCHMSGPCG